MTLTLRSTKGSRLTHAEMDANWTHCIDSANSSFIPSGTGGIAGTVQGQLRKFCFLSDYDTTPHFNPARDALTGTMAIPPTLHFAPHTLGGSIIAWKIRNPDSAHGDWNYNISSASVESGTRNTSVSHGYNVAADGTQELAGEPSLFDTLESDYNNGSTRQMERHLQGKWGDGTNFRCWSWGFARSAKTIIHSVAADNILIQNQGGTFTAMQITAGASSAAIAIPSGSVINSSTNNVSFLTQKNAAGSNSVEIARIDSSDRVSLGTLTIIPNGRLQLFDTTVEISANGSGTLALRDQTVTTNPQKFRVYGGTLPYAELRHNGTNTVLDSSSGNITLGGTATAITVAGNLTVSGTGAHNFSGPISLGSSGHSISINTTNSGSNNQIQVFNNSNTASSTVLIEAVVGGSSADDAKFATRINGGQTWTWGLDNSDSDVWALASGTALGTSNAIRVDASLNVGVGGVSAFGTNAAGVFAVKNGTAPTTGPADTVQFYSSDNSAGNTIPSFFCEGTEVLATGQADSASSVRVKVRINGTVVTLLGI